MGLPGSCMSPGVLYARPTAEEGETVTPCHAELSLEDVYYFSYTQDWGPT